jgi:hypothetical protein
LVDASPTFGRHWELGSVDPTSFTAGLRVRLVFGLTYRVGVIAGNAPDVWVW